MTSVDLRWPSKIARADFFHVKSGGEQENHRFGTIFFPLMSPQNFFYPYRGYRDFFSWVQKIFSWHFCPLRDEIPNRPIDLGATGEYGSGHNPLLKHLKSSLYVRFQETVHQETMAFLGGTSIPARWSGYCWWTWKYKSFPPRHVKSPPKNHISGCNS